MRECHRWRYSFTVVSLKHISLVDRIENSSMERLKDKKKRKGGSAIAALGGGGSSNSRSGVVEISAPTSVKQGETFLVTMWELIVLVLSRLLVLHVNQRFQWVNQDPGEDFIMLQKVCLLRRSPFIVQLLKILVTHLITTHLTRSWELEAAEASTRHNTRRRTSFLLSRR